MFYGNLFLCKKEAKTKERKNFHQQYSTDSIGALYLTTKRKRKNNVIVTV